MAECVAIQNECLNILGNVLEFDEAGIKTLCCSVRKPGHMFFDSNDPSNRIVDSDFNNPLICENRLRRVAHGTRSYHMSGKAITYE